MKMMEQEEIKFGITFGALSPEISEQLKEQGLCMPNRKMVNYFDSLYNALDVVDMCAILPDPVLHTARAKMIKQIKPHIRRIKL